ncbi:MAG: alpha/beta fold hydrolase [Verrucomicrobiae bacterium]|nr:alpha/beta fold hydrolase [Verrucomicrobiae bacterium]
MKQFPLPLLDPAREISDAREDYRKILNGTASKSDIRDYNTLVGRLIQHAKPENGSIEVEDLKIAVDDRLEGDAEFRNAEKIRPADSMVIRGFRDRVVVDGIGAPVVLRFPPEGYSPDEGRFQPATAVLDFSESDGTPRIVLHDTLSHSEAEIDHSGPVPLRADYTAPLASRFAAQDRQRINLLAMLLSERFEDDLGMNQIDATYPNKIPVVFVHGLKSSPITWRDVLNELRSDPIVRDRYEFWTFGYTTGSPIPFSAMKLREALEGMATYRKHLGTETDDVILIGHSMGGLLSRLMTERSGDEVWYQFFKQPVEELPIPAKDREILKRMAYFEPLPFVHDVVFIATPHGGSQIADNAIGQVFSGLIQLPTQLLSLSTGLIRAPFSLLTPAGEEVITRMPTSISQLESQSELLQRLKAMTLNPSVTFHSIIGDRGLGDALGESSDGVVPYHSSHLEGTVSEEIVPAGHNAHQNPQAIEELQRILREHTGVR